MRTKFNHSVIQTNQAKLVTAWLLLGLTALVSSGIFSILLVVSRTPGIHDYIPILDFFHTALVAHVDLSVLVWFLSFSCVFWSLSTQRIFVADWAGLLLAVIGTLIITVSPFLGETKPLLNNYVPVLQQPLFLWGLIIFSFGCVIRLTTRFLSRSENTAFDTGTLLAAIVSILSFVTLIWTYQMIPAEVKGTLFYEQLFWGAGHVLQFSHTVLMLVAWFLLAHVTQERLMSNQTFIRSLLLFAGIPALYAILILFKDIELQREAFTQLMRWGGLAAIPAGFVAVIKSPWKKLSITLFPGARSALLSSIVLFTVGGILAFMIHGINVVIPAHYHGSIVGVTLAFFGVAFYLLPTLGYEIKMPKLAIATPYVYATGQLMHITGLAWSGGYGVQRKTAGAAQDLDRLPEIAGMALMGMGGLVAIIGGILFLVVAFHAILKGKQKGQPNFT